MKRIIPFLVLALILTWSGLQAGITLPRIVFLGARTVDFKVDHDEIIVSRARGRFLKLEFRVTGNSIELFKLAVVYANGEQVSIPTQLIFREGEWSRIIDLEGGRRFIRKITFNYRTVGPLVEGKAEVKVFGIR